jgi:NTE family protein
VYSKSLRRLLPLTDLSPLRRGLFEGQKVREYLTSHLGDRTFDDLRIPLTLVAVDLNSGRAVYLSQGRVVDGVRATTALPGVFTPLDNLPAGAVRRMGADVVIAVDVSSDGQVVSHLAQALHRHRYVPNGLVDTAEVMWRSLGVMRAEIGRRRLAEAHPEIIIRPAIPPDVTVLTGFPRAAEIIAAGEEAAQEALPRIRALSASPAL